MSRKSTNLEEPKRCRDSNGSLACDFKRDKETKEGLTGRGLRDAEKRENERRKRTMSGMARLEKCREGKQNQQAILKSIKKQWSTSISFDDCKAA